MSNPYWTFIQNVVAKVIASSHKTPSKNLSKNLFMTFELYHKYDKVESVMMFPDYVFDDIKEMQALWIPDSQTDASDLAGFADLVLGNGVSYISMPCAATCEMWPWIEKNNIKIFNRFIFANDKDIIDAVSALATSVTAAFKSGAFGAQVFVTVKNIGAFCDAMKPVRQDLFFDKNFSVAIDVDEMRGQSWDKIFDALREIYPDAILITAHGDLFDADSGFVGVVFDMLNNWNLGSDLHVWVGKNTLRVSQVLRLCQKIKPDLVQHMRIFTNAGPRVSE